MVANQLPTPPDLEKAISEFADRESVQWCAGLRCHGVGEDYNWGFRVYRTVYTPESDREFATGLEILRANLRAACFRDAYEGSEDALHAFPNQQLWQRMKFDIVDDRTVFDNASPAAIQQHFHAWIEADGYYLPNDKSPDPSLHMAGSSTHRFCIIIDAEALRNILRFPLHPNDDNWDLTDRIGVKVLDVECHADSEEYPPPFHEGWFWASPWNLPDVWFDYHSLAADEFRDEDELGRPVVIEY